MPLHKAAVLAFSVALVLGATAAGAQAAAKVPLTHEGLWMMKRVGTPIASPDGAWVVYSLTEPSYDTDKAVSDLWLVPADGSAPPRRLTSTKAAESDPAWSRDSRRLAFVAKRDGDELPQVYVLDLAGGDARRVTASGVGAGKPQWRPDGQALLFEASVYPGAVDDAGNRKAAADRKARKYNVRVYDHAPVQYWNEWIDDRRPSVWVQPLSDGAPAVDVLASTAFAKQTGFSGYAAGDGSVSLLPMWSPDGREIVFTATTERWNSTFAHVGYHLYRMPAKGGEPTVVTPVAGGYEQAKFSPDGRSLVFAFSPAEDEVYTLPRLARVAWPAGGASIPVLPGFDREPAAYAITPDSRTVYVLVPEAGSENLYRVPLAGGVAEKVIAPKIGGYTALDIPAKAKAPTLIAQYGSATQPAEIVRIDPVARTHRNLTDVNTAAAAAIDWSAPEHFWFKSVGGRDIHSMIVRPPAFDPKKTYPLLVLMHGGPASSNPDQIGLRWNYHLLASAGYVVLMTDYTGSTGYGEAFSQAIKLDPLKTPADEINQAVDEAAKRYPFIDATNACAAGASYGGHLANWMEAKSTRYKCLVSHAGEVDLVTQWGISDYSYGREIANGGPPWSGSPVWREQSAITYAADWKTPILLSIGEKDYRVPMGNTLEAWTTLQRMKVPSRLLVWPDAWHWITKPEDSRQFYREVQAWLGHYLKDEPAVPEGPLQ